MIENFTVLFNLTLRGLDEAHDGFRRYRFSAAGFAHNCERLTFLERKLYTADCLYFTGIGVIRDSKFLLPERMFCRSYRYLPLITGEVSDPGHRAGRLPEG